MGELDLHALRGLGGVGHGPRALDVLGHSAQERKGREVPADVPVTKGYWCTAMGDGEEED